MQLRVDSLDAKSYCHIQYILKVVDTYKFVNFFLDFVSKYYYFFRYIKYCLGLLNDRFSSFPDDRNELGMNPEFITLINSGMNSGFIPTFQARFDRRKTTKNPSLRVLGLRNLGSPLQRKKTINSRFLQKKGQKSLTKLFFLVGRNKS